LNDTTIDDNRQTTPGEWTVRIDSVKISGADAGNYDPPGYNDDLWENQGLDLYLFPPDSVHIHIRAHMIQDMDVFHRDSITVYDVRYTNDGQTLAAKMFTLRGIATFLNNGNINSIDTVRVVRTLPAGRNWYVSSPMDSTQLPPVDEEKVSSIQIWCDLQNRLHVRNADDEDLLPYNTQASR
jgi:hypothetical protein